MTWNLGRLGTPPYASPVDLETRSTEADSFHLQENVVPLDERFRDLFNVEALASFPNGGFHRVYRSSPRGCLDGY